MDVDFGIMQSIKNLRQIFLSLKNQFVMKYFMGNYFESVLKTKFYLMRRELLFFFLFSVIFCVVFKAALKMSNATRFLLKIVLQLQRYMFQNCIVLKVCTLCFKKIERNIFLYSTFYIVLFRYYYQSRSLETWNKNSRCLYFESCNKPGNFIFVVCPRNNKNIR